MTLSGALPRHLAPWATQLDVLEPDLATAVGPLVRQLDEIMRRHAEPVAAHDGMPDGYGGLSSRGTADRLLMTQWALADEEPLEFLRRAVAGELLYLAPERRETSVRGRVAVLADTGPDQWGASRLVQLVALVVLHRRAASAGRELAVGILGTEPGEWRVGELVDQLTYWLKARQSDDPSDADVEQWTNTLDASDEAWVLAGPVLSAVSHARSRMVVARESKWNGKGATHVEVRLHSSHVELSLPAAGAAINALRRTTFRRNSSLTSATGSNDSVRCARFNGADRWLIARGGSQDELLTVRVATGEQPSRTRRHRFNGPVVGAASIGQRLVVVTVEGDELRVHVRGRRLGSLDGRRVSLDGTGIDPAAVVAETAHGIPQLHYANGDLLWHLSGQWWRIGSAGTLNPKFADAVGIGHALDAPRIAKLRAGRLHIDNESGTYVDAVLPNDCQVLLGPGGLVAWSDGPTAWHTWLGRSAGPVVHVGGGDAVLALISGDDGPALVTVSQAGLIVRIVSASAVQTLTRWSGGVAAPSVHARLPLIVVARTDTTVEIADFRAGTLLMTLSGGDA